ncbi:MAG: RNA methyltransferase [Thermoplasmata archaeon]|jgi:TrmH family RNA methyltransferase|nr:MAG: RNA methyltransferase [Thermoplasmata archaeon]RLF65202.1 MAG: RNA methyltransferase [Thermoplasmata archaeon]
MTEFKIVLVEPKYPGNVGAVARVMMNFGFRDLIIVSDSFSVDDEECRKMAVHAQEVLDNALILPNFEEALSMVDYMAGTSSIESKNEKRHLRNALTLREFSSRAHEMEGIIGIAFGREDYGLFNDELRNCDVMLKIPTSDEYPSLNLSHAVGITLYEIFSQKGKISQPRPADRLEKEKLYEYFDKLLDSINYPEYKKENTKTMFRRIIGRAMLSKWEYHTLMGVLKKSMTK